MPLAVIDPGSTTYYVHADHLNRPLAMTNTAKAFVANYVWLPYGGLYSYTGTTEIDLRFPGQLMQAESGLYYNWNRQYDPTTGRYTQADPLGLVDGSSRYAYVGNDPLQRTDPEGQFGLQSMSIPNYSSPSTIIVTYDPLNFTVCTIQIDPPLPDQIRPISILDLLADLLGG